MFYCDLCATKKALQKTKLRTTGECEYCRANCFCNFDNSIIIGNMFYEEETEYIYCNDFRKKIVTDNANNPTNGTMFFHSTYEYISSKDIATGITADAHALLKGKLDQSLFEWMKNNRNKTTNQFEKYSNSF